MMLERKHGLNYVGLLAVFGAGIAAALAAGSRLGQPASHWARLSGTPPAGAHGPSLEVLLAQILIILAAASGMGRLFRRFGQPRVGGEIIAGLLLGPSLLGALAPEFQAALFPADSLGSLRLMSQVGVVLFMFVVGTHVDLQELRRGAQSVLFVSHASILLPFFLGTTLALFLYKGLAPAGVPFNAFALFLGVAMSITAFPVLARILEDRGLSGTPLGGMALACAAVDDATAWCVLAAVVAIVRSTALIGVAGALLGTVIFAVVMLKVVRPWLTNILGPRSSAGLPGNRFLAGALFYCFGAALATEALGVHAFFGAFLAGVCVPQEPELRRFLRERIETFSSVLLLPLFFALTGLRTQVGLLNGAGAWLVCFAIIGVAVAGKLGGGMAAARWSGMNWKDSFSLGALMNTRGLVELIVLNVGYELGILSPQIFTMLVIMAIVTTLATGPLLDLANRIWKEPKEA